MPTSSDEVSTPAADPVRIVHEFVRVLCARYRHLCGAGDRRAADHAGRPARLSELILAEAVLRHGCGSDTQGATPAPRLGDGGASRPPQLAVLGPTQTGKSTIVNLLLGREVAEVSALAGFTVHAQGFWITSGDRDPAWTEWLFPGWQRREADALVRDDLEAYALTIVDCPGAEAGGLPRCVVWDTPDFDSLAAQRYERGVLEVAALADAYVLVLSKEKYSDLSVWRMLRLLEPLGRPLLICLNKTTPDAADALLSSLKQRLAELGGAWGEVPIIPIPYQPSLGPVPDADLPAVAHELRRTVPACLAAAATRASAKARPRSDGGACALIRRHWEEWTDPLRAEHAAVAAWDEQIDKALGRLVDVYRRDYLDHPQRYDAFRRAAVELLNLLEIPKVSGWMRRARQYAAWPARQLLLAGRSWWEQRRTGRLPGHQLGSEAAVLFDAIDGLLTTLQRDVARRCDPGEPGYVVWRALSRRLEREEGHLRDRFRVAVEAHHEHVTREVHVVANQLFEDLKGQPARLAVLRTARATIDVGYLLIVVKTGGLTPLDVVWAPATFGLTTLLMEGIAGLQMDRVSKDLKRRQLESVQQSLVQEVFVRELRSLVENLDDEGLFAISPARLEHVERALSEWEGRA
ncbi:MAG: 50S ribosome-binding GTPase [Planctomycetes bacterium]|nr:50S ribosome-binding GTPase [Planctomycetota bacterium]